MSQRHLDRLTPVDASFLHQESSVSHMHIGGLTIIEGPPPGMEEFLEQNPPAAAPRSPLPPQARAHRDRQRAAGVDR